MCRGGTIYFSIVGAGLMLATLFAATSAMAQVPSSINYQAVARDLATGQELPETPIMVVFKLREGGPNGTIVYQETHDTQTDEYGLFNVRIGEGDPIEDTFDQINWGQNEIWLSVAIDAGNGLEELSTTQMVAVPYALFAKTTENTDDADADPANETIQSFSFTDSLLTLEENENGSPQTFQVDMSDVLANPDADPGNERIVDFSLSDSTLLLLEGQGVNQQEFQVALNDLLQDEDVELGNEWISSIALQNDTLRIVEGNPPNADLSVLNLAPLIDDADADPTNELIEANSLALNGTVLSITEAGTTYQADLASIEDDDDWIITGDELYSMGRKVGINNSSPNALLEVKGNNVGEAVNMALFTNLNGDTLLELTSDNHTGIGSTATSNTLHVTGSIGGAVDKINASETTVLTLDGTHHIVLCNVATASMEVVLPSASSVPGREYYIKRIGSNTVTISTTGTNTIDGQNSVLLSALTTQQVGVVSDGETWWIFSR